MIALASKFDPNGILRIASLLIVLAGACGGDDNPPGMGGTDAGRDAALDAGWSDAGPDSGPTEDGGGTDPDGAPAIDGGGGRDAGSEADANVGVDGGSPGDAGPGERDGGSESDSGTEPDSGITPDAGPGPDSGITLDAGPGRDSGITLDAGPGRDSGITLDAGPGRDSGITLDAGPGRDSGITLDAGPRRDGGAGRDAGTGADGGAMCGVGSVTVAAMCPEFRACGGSLPGRYCYRDVCLTHAEIVGGTTLGTCGLSDLTFRDFSGTIQGEVIFTDSRVSRMASMMFSGTIDVPARCIPIGARDCTAVESVLRMRFPATRCAMAPGSLAGCSCTIAYSWSDMTSTTYMARGNVIRTGSGRVYEYCVSSGQLRVRDETPLGAEPGLQSLESR
ncbi:MAG: hypothetical protein RMK74_02015 [Myxococcales bacterium]|nr:hypothetical protein [Myxococcales bacterium]